MQAILVSSLVHMHSMLEKNTCLSKQFTLQSLDHEDTVTISLMPKHT